MYAAEQTRQPAPDRQPHVGGVLGGVSIRGITEAGAKQPQLDAVTERLRLCAGEMQGTVNELETRLRDVLNPEFKNDTIASGSVPPRAVRCPLGDAIDEVADNLHHTTQRLRGLIERLAT